MRYSLLLVFFTAFVSDAMAQGCTVDASAPFDTIVCGQNILLSAYGQGQGVAILSENFNNGSFGPGWSATTQAMWNNPCSPNGVDGTTHIWLGNSSPVPRSLTTAIFDLSNCANAGVTICFDMKFAEQGNAAPCEGPDEPDEGVYLQYSTNGGASWSDIHYFDPNGGNDPQLINWNNWCFQVPQAALTSATQFRWFQDNDSGADYDHWGIDNVVIYCNDPSYNIVWQHDNYSLGPSGGTDPNAVAPHQTTTYTVVMSNGSNTCVDSVTVFVRNPTLVVDAGNDTTICPGSCAQLNATAKVIVSPAKVATYSNNEITPITTGLGQVSNININVTGLNMPTVLPNAITEVCINNVFFFGFGGLPPAQVDIGDLILTLTCPSGQTITLVPANVTTGGSNPLTGGYSNTCFVPAGGANIATGTAPYSGSWAPNQPFSNLAGCTANGLWSLNVTMNTSLGFGSGTFSGWSITFDDPEISYTGNFVWNPTSNMTGANSLTPNVCPPSSTTYNLTVQDTAGCVSASDAVQVNVQPCCSFTFSPVVTSPSCAQNNGSVTMNIVNGSGNYTYVWSNGSSTNTASNLGAGTISVTVTDNVQNCNKDTSFTLNSASSINLNFSNPVNPTCAGGDGSVTVNLSGGTAPYQVTIDTGGTPQTITLPIAISQNLTNLPAGTVNVSVTDAQGCQTSNSVTLTAPANCCTFSLSPAVTQPTCAQNNGSVTMNILNGSGNYSYAWSDGSLGNSISNVGPGMISVTVTDNGQNCTKDTSLTLNSNSTLNLTFSNQVNPSCAGWDGSVTVNLSGGSAPYQVTIDTGGTPQTITVPIAISQALSNLPAGTVNVSVTDAQGCQTSNSVTLTAPTNCCTMTLSAVITQPSCATADGAIDLTVTNGSGNYSYDWGGGVTTEDVSNLGAGIVSVAVTDNAYANCEIDTSFILSNPGGPVIDSVVVTDETCTGTADGAISIYASGGAGNYVYNWNFQSGGTATETGLSSGNYSFTVVDANLCQVPGVATVGLGTGCCTLQSSAAVSQPGCGQTTGEITVNVTTAGTPPYTYSIDGISYQQSATFTNLSPGNYEVITQDANQCHDTVSVIINQAGANLTLTVTATDVSCYGADDGTVTAIPNNGNAPYTYQWNTTPVQATATAANLIAGMYSVTATDQSGCSGTGSATVAQPALLTVSLGDDTTACEGTPVFISAGNGFASYAWSSGQSTADIFVQATGTYTVTVTDANGCTASDAVVVTLTALPEVQLGEDKTVYVGDHVGLNATISGSPQGGTYNWQPDTLLSCVNCQNPVAIAVDTMAYTLVYTDAVGCSSSDTIVLYVLPVANVFFPNAFTPNGDGNNDVFVPYGSSIKLIDLKIFNRWGEKVFESTNFLQGWDGIYKGKMQPPGVYVYFAKVVLLNNEEKKYTGSLTLIR